MTRSRRLFLKALSLEAALPAMVVAEHDRPQGSVPVAPMETGASLRRGPYLQCQGPDRIMIRWRSDQSSINGLVRYGTGLDKLDQVVVATSSRSENHDGLDWHAQLLGLRPETHYFYAIENSKAILAGFDEEHFFVTAPEVGKPRSARFWVLGDCGTNRVNSGNPGKSLSARNGFRKYRSQNPNLDGMILLGDNAYSHGTDAQYQSAIFQVYQDELKNLTVWPCIGNHELTDDYLEIFTVPGKGEIGGVASNSKNYYSWDFANIHFTVLDLWKSEWRNDLAAQIEWLKADLSKTRQQWKVAINHFPPYCDGKYESDNNGFLVEVRQKILPILEDHGVDLFLTGHDHTYQRSFLLDGHYGPRSTFDPQKHMKSNADGVAEPIVKKSGARLGLVTVVTGTAGAEQPADLANPLSPQLNHPAMVKLAKGDQSMRGIRRIGTFLLEISGEKLTGTQIDDRGEILDRFTMIKHWS